MFQRTRAWSACRASPSSPANARSINMKAEQELHQLARSNNVGQFCFWQTVFFSPGWRLRTGRGLRVRALSPVWGSIILSFIGGLLL